MYYSKTPLKRSLRGAIESVHIKRIEFRDIVRVSFPRNKANCP